MQRTELATAWIKYWLLYIYLFNVVNELKNEKIIL